MAFAKAPFRVTGTEHSISLNTTQAKALSDLLSAFKASYSPVKEEFFKYYQFDKIKPATEALASLYDKVKPLAESVGKVEVFTNDDQFRLRSELIEANRSK